MQPKATLTNLYLHFKSVNARYDLHMHFSTTLCSLDSLVQRRFQAIISMILLQHNFLTSNVETLVILFDHACRDCGCSPRHHLLRL